VEPPMHVDQVGEPELAAETVRTAERLGSERRQVIDVLWLAGTEERLKKRVRQHRRVERVLQSVEAFLAAGMFEERRHAARLSRLDPSR
jgi:hypothetical protein